jgi:16S rRNA (cytosine967-C5)-methyltransferase
VSALLSDRGVGVSDVEGMPDALMVSDTGGPVAELPGYRDGLFAVQGAASQMIAPLVRAHEDHRILDACAAPGGKTAHLAALTRNKASIVAVDANAQRLDQTRANLARLGVASAQCLLGDSGSQPFVDSLAVFDRILVDAPCSNLGVLRHNPEVKYRIEPRDVDELAARQRLLVQNTARALRSGGILVYAVCTSTEKETIAVIESFLSENKEFMPAPIERSEVAYPEYVDDRGFLMTFPPSSEHPVDGFFAARLRRL